MYLTTFYFKNTYHPSSQKWPEKEADVNKGSKNASSPNLLNCPEEMTAAEPFCPPSVSKWRPHLQNLRSRKFLEIGCREEAKQDGK